MVRVPGGLAVSGCSTPRRRWSWPPRRWSGTFSSPSRQAQRAGRWALALILPPPPPLIYCSGKFKFIGGRIVLRIWSIGSYSYSILIFPKRLQNMKSVKTFLEIKNFPLNSWFYAIGTKALFILYKNLGQFLFLFDLVRTDMTGALADLDLLPASSFSSVLHNVSVLMLIMVQDLQRGDDHWAQVHEEGVLRGLHEGEIIWGKRGDTGTYNGKSMDPHQI